MRRPFSRKEITCFLLWIAIGLMLVTALGYWLLNAPGHQQLQPKNGGSSSALVWPGSEALPRG